MQQRPLFVVDQVKPPVPTRRNAYCSQHSRISNDYVGANSKGLIFRCEGRPGAPETWHYYISGVAS